MTSRHLIPHGYLSLLGDIDTNRHVDPRRELITVLPRKYFGIDDNTVLSVGHLQGSIPHFSRFLAEDRAQQSLLGRQLRLALRRHFADQNITGAHLRADADDPVAVQIFQRIVTHAGHILCDALCSQLRIAGLRLILFNMNGCIDILSHQPFADQDRILVVVTFPGHKTDQRVFAQRQLALCRGGTVRDHLPRLYMIALFHDRLLVITVGLVASHKLCQMILIRFPVVAGHLDDAGGHIGDRAVLSRHHTDTGIHRRLLLHTCSDCRRFREQKRHCLTLHVGTHQRTMRIIVLQKRNQGSRHGKYHFRGHIHIIHPSLRIVLGLLHITPGHALADKISVVVQYGRRLGNIVVVFLIRCHIYDLIRDSRILRIALVNFAVRCLHETVLIDPRVARKRVDQTDVGTLRRLDRAHTPIVRIVYVTHLESCAVSGKSARSQRGQTSLVGQLAQRICLVHEL